jgi:hypothetical protein
LLPEVLRRLFEMSAFHPALIHSSC